MTIKGLSKIRRVTRAGHIRIGEKKKNKDGVEYPWPIDHFIPDFTSESKQAAFVKKYGAHPKVIQICFHSNDPEEIFPQFYKCYGAGSGIKCRGDGETATRWDGKGGTVEVECKGHTECTYALDNGCKPLASLMFFVKGIDGLDVAQLNTSSKNSIININTGLDMLRLARCGKSIAGVWVDLLLVPQESKAAGKKVNIFVLKIDIPVSLDNLIDLQSNFQPPRELVAPSEERDPMLYPEGGFAPESDDAQEPPTEVEAVPVPEDDTEWRKRLQADWAAMKKEFSVDNDALKAALASGGYYGTMANAPLPTLDAVISGIRDSQGAQPPAEDDLPF